jgi:NAD(P)-dependent dehydrogenase (short-subunit alcohol dehydrogenase family)
MSPPARARDIAERVIRFGHFDAVIHNVGVGYREPIETEDGLPACVFAVNVLAPYVLTAPIENASSLVSLSCGMHQTAVLSWKI